jgi:predicted Zn-dependent protease
VFLRIPSLLRLAVAFGWVAFSALASGQAGSSEDFDSLLHRGFELHQQARFTESIPVLARARSLRPRDYFANLLLGIDELRTGDVKAAIPHLQAAARIRLKEPIPKQYLGEAEARLGHFAEAAADYQDAVTRSHGGADALESWAEFALERFRSLGEGLRASDAGVKVIHELERTSITPAATCEESIPALERQLAARKAGGPSAVAIAGKLSVCYSLEAGKTADKLKSSTDDPAALASLQGDILLRLKQDAPAAQQAYQKAIAARPGDPAILERLAEAQLAAGDVEAARASSEAALHINPHAREAMRTLASIAMDRRDYDAALPLLTQLALESPADFSVQVELGRALVQTGKAAEALDHLKPVLDAGYPDEKGALHALEARALRQLGRDAEAEKASAEARRRSDAFQARNKEGGREKPNDDQ